MFNTAFVLLSLSITTTAFYKYELTAEDGYYNTSDAGKTHARSENLSQPLVYRGYPANSSEFPYVVAILNEMKGPGYTHSVVLCGGSIISEVWVLTAGHCVEGRAINIYIITSMNKVSVEFAADGRIITAKNSRPAVYSYIHKGYKTRSYEIVADIAVVKVEKKFEVTPISLPEEGYDVPPNLPVIFAGYGETERGTFGHLRKIQLTVLSKLRCASPRNRRLLCTSGGGDTGPCSGDSGSPLVTADGIQVGIISFVSPAVWCGYDHLYMNVVYYRKWIRETTGV